MALAYVAMESTSFEVQCIKNNDQHIYSDQQTYSDQQSQKYPLEKEADQQRVGIKAKCCNALRTRLDFVNLVRRRDKSAKQSNAKINKTKVNKILKLQDIPFIAKLIYDIMLFIYFLATFIHSIVQFAVNQDSLSYNIVCIIISFIGLTDKICKLAYELYKKLKKKHRVSSWAPISQSR